MATGALTLELRQRFRLLWHQILNAAQSHELLALLPVLRPRLAAVVAVGALLELEELKDGLLVRENLPLQVVLRVVHHELLR